MRTKTFHITGFLAVSMLLTLSVHLLGEGRPSARGRSWALVGGTVYVSPTEPPIQDGVIVLQGDTITTVGQRSAVHLPADIEKLDCSGLTITAGFWNSHVHFIQRKWASVQTVPAAEVSGQMEDMITRWGFTSVFDTGSAWENTRRLRDRVESGEIPGPRIRSTGEILFPKGGAPEMRILDVTGTMRVQLPEVSTPDEASAAAKKLLDAGTDGIKVYAASLGWPTVLLPQTAIEAAAKEAHLRGKPVLAHPQTRDGLMAAVQGGADVLVHSVPNAGQLDDATIALMKSKGIAMIPTLKLWSYEAQNERKSQRDQFVKAGVDQLRSWVDEGGTVVFGTDVGYMHDYDTTEEYELMSQAGMNARQILASLTTAPAERFGDSKRLGRIASGFGADLVVLDKDPSEDVRAFAAVRYTIRDGKVIYKASTNLARADEGLTPRNKAIVRDFYTTVMIGHDVDAAPRFLRPDYIQHNPQVPTGLKGFMETFRARFAQPFPPDYKRELLNLIGENDMVVIYVRQTLTSREGQHHQALGFDMFRVPDGMIAEHWDAD